jgi:predicted TIM-barrel fold metal-dependent hydrolase
MSPADAPIVDPHQHFWDLGRNYHPWLCDPVPIAFRYGDYSAIKRNYLPADYRRDAGRLQADRLEKLQLIAIDQCPGTYQEILGHYQPGE